MKPIKASILWGNCIIRQLFRAMASIYNLTRVKSNLGLTTVSGLPWSGDKVSFSLCISVSTFLSKKIAYSACRIDRWPPNAIYTEEDNDGHLMRHPHLPFADGSSEHDQARAANSSDRRHGQAGPSRDPVEPAWAQLHGQTDREGKLVGAVNFSAIFWIITHLLSRSLRLDSWVEAMSGEVISHR